MIKGVIEISSELFLSDSFLIDKGISTNTLKKWKQRDVGKYITHENVRYILFSSIPEPSRVKLPCKEQIRLQVFDEKVKSVYERLSYVVEKNHYKLFEYYKKTYALNDYKALITARKHAVWQWIIDNYSHNKPHGLETLYAAFCKIYADNFSSKHSFSNRLKKALLEGAESVAFDSRVLNVVDNAKSISIDNKFWVSSMVSIGKKFGPVEIHRKLSEICKECNKTVPSLSWVKKYYRELLKTNYSVFESRTGQVAARAKKDTYASMIHALHANSQWQMDGWTLPFFGDNFQRYVVVLVRDAHSKKVVGYSVGKSENTTIISEALRDAVSSTGYLPGEIVMDNHSFNKTKEAAWLKEQTSSYGVQWTITSNPQYKSIVERYFQHLNSLCKDFNGFLGEGVTSKRQNARPSPETIASYKFLTVDEIKLNAIAVVEAFNEAKRGNGLSPNEAYLISDKPHCFKVDVFDRVKLLTAQSEFKVSRGQINIVRGGVKYEYQLTSDMYMQYNDNTVIVQYEDLNDCIYLFDADTKKPIGSLSKKAKIHGALVDQTDKDKDLLFKNKGRNKGIKSKSRKDNEALRLEALKANPDAIDLLQKHTMPKDLVSELEKNKHLKQRAEQLGIIVTELPQRTVQSGVSRDFLDEPVKGKENPFFVKSECKIINPSSEDEDD